MWHLSHDSKLEFTKWQIGKPEFTKWPLKGALYIWSVIENWWTKKLKIACIVNNMESNYNVASFNKTPTKKPSINQISCILVTLFRVNQSFILSPSESVFWCFNNHGAPSTFWTHRFWSFQECFTLLSWTFIWMKVLLLPPRLATSTRELRMRTEVFFFLSVFVWYQIVQFWLYDLGFD